MTSYREGEILSELHFAVSRLLPWTNHVIEYFCTKKYKCIIGWGGGCHLKLHFEIFHTGLEREDMSEG